MHKCMQFMLYSIIFLSHQEIFHQLLDKDGGTIVAEVNISFHLLNLE